MLALSGESTHKARSVLSALPAVSKFDCYNKKERKNQYDETKRYDGGFQSVSEIFYSLKPCLRFMNNCC